MLKRVFLLSLLGVGFAFFGVSSVVANEGVAILSPISSYKGECFVASVYMESGYSVLASCRNLPTALGAENNRLILWREAKAKKNGELSYERVGELKRGKLSASVSEPFSKLFVTAERRSYPSTPEGPVLVRGGLEPISFKFSNSAVISPVVSATISPKVVSDKGVGSDVTTKDKGVDVGIQVKDSGNKLASVFRGIVKVVGFGFLLLLVIVGVLGFVARKRGKL